ncbi:MAG: hypothetical protein ACRCWJ_23400 [Casimicrobium sp.]
MLLKTDRASPLDVRQGANKVDARRAAKAEGALCETTQQAGHAASTISNLC